MNYSVFMRDHFIDGLWVIHSWAYYWVIYNLFRSCSSYTLNSSCLPWDLCSLALSKCINVYLCVIQINVGKSDSLNILIYGVWTKTLFLYLTELWYFGEGILGKQYFVLIFILFHRKNYGKTGLCTFRCLINQ